MKLFDVFRKSAGPTRPAILAPPANPQEEYELGYRHASGQGVDRNRILAYKWLTLAARHGHEQAGDLRDMIAERMTASEISDAERLVRDCAPSAKLAVA